MRNWKRIAAVGGTIAIVALAALWLWASPMWTLRDMGEAARRGDSAVLDEHIDYAALKNDLKTQMIERIRKQAPEGPAAEIALAFGTGAIDAMVTPERLRVMVQGESDGNGIVTADNVGIERTGPTGFVAGTKTPEGIKGGAVFALQGVTWRIVGVRIPESRPQAVAPMAWPKAVTTPGATNPTK